MLNILKGVKFAQDDSTGDVYAVDCVDGPKKLTGGSSGGGGGAGQFIVNVYNTNASGTQFAADKTYEEISAAIESGASVVIRKKTNIDAATYDVYYHNTTGSGYYTFCHITYGKTAIVVRNLGISMVNGEMNINHLSTEIQVS